MFTTKNGATWKWHTKAEFASLGLSAGSKNVKPEPLGSNLARWIGSVPAGMVMGLSDLLVSVEKALLVVLVNRSAATSREMSPCE
jgi:hypothetical protein